MSNHTPGPWELFQNPDDQFGWPNFDIGTRRFQSLAHVRAGSDEAIDEGCPEANARLIAAAPDMLEALEAAVESGIVPKSSVFDGGASKYSEQVKIADQIRGAIAKATGQEVSK